MPKTPKPIITKERNGPLKSLKVNNGGHAQKVRTGGIPKAPQGT